MLTIVKYHYVRDVAGGRFPNMKCLAVDDFHGQLDHFGRNYTVINPLELFEALEKRNTLATNALLMTFDDGYIEHYDTVYPALKARGMSAAFFPVGSVLAEGKPLGINKIHLILGIGKDLGLLNARLEVAVARYCRELGLPDIATYRTMYAHPSRLDDAETVFFKRMLQVGLPEPIRTMILDDLFHELVAEDEGVMARQLYMAVEHLENMIADGMYVGCHGYSHEWMDHLSAEEQRADIEKSLRVLSRVRGVEPLRMFCYPFGGYSSGLVELLRCRGFCTGVTIEVRPADLATDDPLLLPRVDTVDLPFSN